MHELVLLFSVLITSPHPLSPGRGAKSLIFPLFAISAKAVASFALAPIEASGVNGFLFSNNLMADEVKRKVWVKVVWVHFFNKFELYSL
jgi:hypothetical protein